MNFEEILRFAVDQGASDVHVQAGTPPLLRIAGEMRRLDMEPLTETQTHDLIVSILPPSRGIELDTASVQGLDFSYVIPAVARFRCNVYRQLGKIGIVLRIIRLEIPSIADLNLPKVVQDIALARRGFVLVTGTTGSGKSTTLAAMIDLVNRTHQSKIITIEDPVEYVHTNDKSLVSQFEVGTDTPSFGRALRQSLRQDPDVILVGELRDVESLRIGLHAADTGHQVFSTVHSTNAPQTIERIIAMFPPAEHRLLLSQLAGSLEAIISQRLIRDREGNRRPAVEILRGSALTEHYILENELNALHKHMESGDSGMQTFDQHLLKMYLAELVSAPEALRWASNSEALSMKMRMSRYKKKRTP
jgi:twitching motility protein PilT